MPPCARLTANTRESSGSMASQMRCAAMLANVAKDSSRMVRRVAGAITEEVDVALIDTGG